MRISMETRAVFEGDEEVVAGDAERRPLSGDPCCKDGCALRKDFSFLKSKEEQRIKPEYNYPRNQNIIHS